LLRLMRPVLVLLLLSVSWLGMSAPAAAEGGFRQGVLWKVQRSGLRPSYVFGTYHIPDPDILRLPKAVLDPFRAADSVTIELEIAADTVAKLRHARQAAADRTLDRVLTPDLLEAAVAKAATYGLGRSQVLALKPWALADIFAQSPANLSQQAAGGLPLDLWLRREALRKAKPCYGLESAQEQIDMFDLMPLGVQAGLLESALHTRAEGQPSMRAFYLARDIGALEDYWESELARLRPDDAAMLDARFLTDRNRRMVTRMARRLFEGNAFIAVGALHLPGEGGVLRLLERQGYSVTAEY
jgi:uncharacterized protein